MSGAVERNVRSVALTTVHVSSCWRLLNILVLLMIAGALCPLQRAYAAPTELPPGLPPDSAESSSRTAGATDISSIPVDSLFARVDALRAGGNYAQALDLARQLELRLERDPTAGAWHREDADALIQLLEKIQTLAADARHTIAIADSLRAAAYEHWDRGRFTEGLAAIERRLHLLEQILGREDREVATAINDLAVMLKARGDYAAAEPLAREAVDLQRDLRGDEHPEVVVSLNNLSCLLRDMGRYREAEPFAREALTKAARLFGPDDPALAIHLNNLGGVYYYLGEYTRAEPLFRQALAIRRTQLGAAHQDVAQSLNNLAFLLKAQGDLAGAEALFREALATQRSVHGDEHPVVAGHINNLANTLSLQQRHEEAQALYRDGLRICRTLLGDEHPRVAQIMTSLATSLCASGDSTQAQRLFDEALALRRKTLGPQHPDVATTLSRLGRLHQGRGNDGVAQTLFEEALAIRRRSFGHVHVDVASSLYDLGLLHLERASAAEAESLLSAAAEIFEVTRLRAGTGLARATFQVSPYRALAVARLLAGKSASAWPAVERAQGRVLADLLFAAGRRQLTPAEQAREDSLQEALARLESQVQALALERGRNGDARVESEYGYLRNQLLATQAACSRFERDLAARHPIVAGEPFHLHRIQASLDAQTVLVGWLDHTFRDGRYRAWAYVVRDTGAVAWVPLAPERADRHGRHPLEAAADYRQSLIVAGSWPFRVTSTDRISQDGEDLWSAWLQPALPHLSGARHLIVVPSEPLLGIPVESLIRDGGRRVGESGAYADEGGRYAADAYTVSYAPSASVWACLREQCARQHGTDLRRGLLVGDPPYTTTQLAQMRAVSSASTSRDLVPATIPPQSAAPMVVRQREAMAGWVARDALAGNESALASLPRLPATREEIRRLAQVIPETITLLGPEASEQNLAELATTGALRGFDLLHLATHAIVDPERPERSALVLSRTNLPDPLQASLAGERIFDGLVTMGDIVREWELDADLVTLSGCQTGLGRRADGEGFVGLAHAFMQAGARSVLVSLWKVDDEATARLMIRFYQNLSGAYPEDRGQGPAAPMATATALGEARAWLRSLTDADGVAPYAHPAFWSGFILLGAASTR